MSDPQQLSPEEQRRIDREYQDTMRRGRGARVLDELEDWLLERARNPVSPRR